MQSSASPTSSSSVYSNTRFSTPPRLQGTNRSESPNKLSQALGRFSVERGKQADEARVFALSDTLSVRLAATHPIEMQQAFRAADPHRDVFTGSIHVFDEQINYSVVNSVHTCFVWKNDLNSPSHPPTCYMFPVPPPAPSIPYLALPFASLLPFGTSREPGLILVSSSGEVRFWDSIGIGLAGAERFSTAKINLEENETVEGLERVNSTVYIARTRMRLHRLTVTARPGTGKFAVVTTLFNDPHEGHSSTWLSPFRMLQRRNGAWNSGEILAVVSSSYENPSNKDKALITRGSQQTPLWVLTSRRILKWNVNLEGGEQCELNHEAREIVSQTILKGLEASGISLDLELLDIAVDASGDPTLLISHEPLQSQEASPLEVDKAPARVYALVRLQLTRGSDAFEVKGDIEILPYELTPDIRTASPPRLALLQNLELGNGLELAFSQFSDAFAFTSREPPYQEQLHLKNVDDIILGFSILERPEGSEMLLLTSGMTLAARPNVNNIVKMRDDVNIGRANVLKSTIRQAMKYGIKPENPLRFQLPSIADGESLMSAAVQMSHAFLTSDPDVVPSTLSMGAQLTSRENSLHALATFIGQSGGLDKLSQSTREHLLADAEKLAAAHGLWDFHNAQTQNVSSPSLLSLAIETYMNDIGGSIDGDAVRAFFKSQVPHIGAIVPVIAGIVHSELSASEMVQNRARLLTQANGLVLGLLTNAFQYRLENQEKKYRIAGSVVQPWTSEPSLLVKLRRLFDITVLLTSQTPGSYDDPVFGGSNIRDELISQLRELASCLFKAYRQQLDFLDSRSQEGGGSERERNKVEEEFRALRPEVLDHLVQIDGTDYAFKLAESHRDFHALSELSYHASANKIVPASDRIRDYIQRFRDEFTSELYKWYIEQGKLKLMFDQEAELGNYIDSFFAKNPSTRISWIHDIGKQDYQGAASALLGEAETETSRETRHLMLSIGKLASMAEGPATTPQDKLQAFNNSLDFMSIHDTLLEQFNEEFGSPAGFAVESRVQKITSARCTIPSDRPALLDLFQRVLRWLLQGKALSEEDTVDLLSMKDNGEHPNDFVDALIILSNSPYMSESRKTTSMRNVWRRIYLHDDWKPIRDTANKTDRELATMLRDTQLYKTLASPSLPQNSITTPSEALEIPTIEQIEVRWSGMAPNQVYELHQDFARESRVLSDTGPSDEEFLQVHMLVNEDR